MPQNICLITANQKVVREHQAQRAGNRLLVIRNFADLFSLTIGLLATIELSLVGTIMTGDLLFFCVFVFLLPKHGKRLLHTRFAMLLALLIVWLIGQVATDVIRHSDAQDYLRGWGKITMFAFNFAGAYLFLRTDRRLILYLIGLSVGMAARYFYNPIEVYSVDPWKWAFGWPTTVLLVILATIFYKPKAKRFSITFLLFACALNFYFNFRSEALFCFVSAASLSVSSNGKKQSIARLAAVGICLALSVWAFSGIYGSLAGAGYLGREAQLKYEEQSSGDDGMLLAARDESLASSEAIKDSPFIGHGSWARDPQYSELIRNKLAQRGYKVLTSKQETIPSHSHLAGAWVDAGILGTFFWWLVLFITAKAFMSLLMHPSRLRPLSIFFAATLLWDIPFSPFGSVMTVITPIYIILMLRALHQGGENTSALPLGIVSDTPRYASSSNLK